MSQSSSCPVCGRQGLAPDCANCPQCDSDLTCFQVLDALSSKTSSEPVAKKQGFPWLAVVSGATVLLLLVIVALNMKSSFAELYYKVVTLSAPETAPSQQIVSHAEVNQSDGKIHIDAQIRIMDDRQAGKKSQLSKTASEENKQSENQPLVVSPKGEQAAISVTDLSSQQDTLSEAKVAQEVIFDLPEQKSDNGKKNQPVELSEPATKQAIAATPETQSAATETVAAQATALPVLKATRKRWIKLVSGLRESSPILSRQATRATSSALFFYQAQDGETVWELAERFYGEGKYYPVIMELNPQIFKGSVKGSSKVRLFADRRQAAAQYRRKTEQRDGLLLWKHKVQPGETWQSLYARFFPPRYSGRVFYPGDQKVAPGNTVNIILR